MRVRQGDKLCSLAAERLNVTTFPNQQFPRGIMVSCPAIILKNGNIIDSSDTSTICAALRNGWIQGPGDKEATFAVR